MHLFVKNLTPLGFFAWSLLIIAGGVLLHFGFMVWRGRRAMRTIEAAHNSTHGLHHNEITFKQLPKRLQKLISKHEPELLKLGFSKLLTGSRLKLNVGGANSYWQIWCSPDKHTTIEFILTRVGRVFNLLPIRLPLSGYFGPSTLAISLESFFEDTDTLVTSTQSDLKEHAPPFCIVNVLPETSSVNSLWDTHQSSLRELLQNEGRKCVYLGSPDAHSAKEQKQREMFAELNSQMLKKLREESLADLWDPERGKS